MSTPYVNTIGVEIQPPFPGDLAVEERLASLMRWNALAMVVRANQAHGDLGGHIASYASAADLFEVGFNHFFHAREGTGPGQHRGDLVFFQPHSAPGVYARAFLDGRLAEADLAHYWGVLGDSEMDEPESMSALTLAAREKLDNRVWVVNCNLQRLDGPVGGNGRIVDELEKLFAGAGWNVIKLVWGSDWDGLFARDLTGALARAFSDTVDGQMQTFAAKDGCFNRDTFFGQNEELRRLAQSMTDEQIDRLKRGGHDLVKIHAAYSAAAAHSSQPTVILAHTKKGYGMGKAGQGRMTTHSQKKFDGDELIEFRNRFNLPLTDEQVTQVEFFKPANDSPEMRYLHEHRQALGGYLPVRNTEAAGLPKPELASYAQFAVAAAGKELKGGHAAAPFVTQQLGASAGPVIAASDCVRAVSESIRAFIPEGRRYVTLGTDGFVRSDTRADLREFFGVDAASIGHAARMALRLVD